MVDCQELKIVRFVKKVWDDVDNDRGPYVLLFVLAIAACFAAVFTAFWLTGELMWSISPAFVHSIAPRLGTPPHFLGKATVGVILWGLISIGSFLFLSVIRLVVYIIKTWKEV